MLPAQPNQSLIDGMACLQAIAVAPHPVGVRELARPLGLEPTRVHRLVKTLAHLGFARQTPDRKYQPGPGMHVLFAQSLLASNLLRRAATPLQSLGNQGLQVALGVLWRDHVCYLYHARPGTQLIDAIGGRNVYPATRSSIGLVLLASIDEAEVRRTYAKTDIPGFSSITALLSELRRVRKLGYAEVVTTPRPRDATLAVPLGDHPEAAIAFAGQSPASRRPELLTLLHRAATQIVSASSSLAHPPPVTTKGRT